VRYADPAGEVVVAAMARENGEDEEEELRRQAGDGREGVQMGFVDGELCSALIEMRFEGFEMALDEGVRLRDWCKRVCKGGAEL
jgi:hypothetical protein